MSKKTRIIWLLCLFCPINTWANENDCDAENSACVAVGNWDFKLGLGLGVRSNPLIDSDNIPLIVIPQLSYYGKRFFIDNLDIGYSLFESEQHMVNIISTPNYDRVFFERSDPSNLLVDLTQSASGAIPNSSLDNSDRSSSTPSPSRNANFTLDRRDFSLLGGVELSSAFSWGELQLMLLSDISNVHNGQEFRFAYRTSAQNDKVYFGLTLGFNWKSAEVLDYYYGVDNNETNRATAVYQANAGITPFVRVQFRRLLNNKWQGLLSLQHESLSNQIKNSPIVIDENVTTAFLGVIYDF